MSTERKRYLILILGWALGITLSYSISNWALDSINSTRWLLIFGKAFHRIKNIYLSAAFTTSFWAAHRLLLVAGSSCVS